MHITTKKPGAKKPDQRPADRGGNKPMHPGKLGSSDRFHRRVEALVSSAVRCDCKQIQVWHCPDGGAVREELISTIELNEEAPTARTHVDQVVLTIQDEAASLPGGGFHAFSVRGMNADGLDVVRERIRIPGTAPASASDRLARAEIGEEIDHEAGLERASGLALHPREVATLAGITRQQMRHNEALIAMVVKGFGANAEVSQKLIEQMGMRVLTLTEKLEKQADMYLDSHRRTKLVEAEARASDARGRAIEIGSQVLADYLPVALHRITRKHGLAGDAELDPLMEKMLDSFDEAQLPKLAEILKPQQQALFADVWMTVQARKEARKKEAAAKEAKKQEGSATDEQ
jgi:hypothetical protein